LHQSARKIYVSSLASAPTQIKKTGAHHVVTLLHPDAETLAFEKIPPQNHLKLLLNDLSAHSAMGEGLMAPHAVHIHRLVDFIKAWLDHPTPLFIHCYAGVSRSTAAAYIALCLLQPEQDEFALAAYLRAQSPTATPNPWLVQLADDYLEREGRMSDAIAQIGRGAHCYEGAPFCLEV
jgi:predicted protein tyrosine phosphatase